MSKRLPVGAGGKRSAGVRKSVRKKGVARKGVRKSSVTRSKKGTRTVRKPTARAAGREFPALRKADGVGAVIAVAERVGGKWDESREIIQWRQRRTGGAGLVGRSRQSIARTVEALSAVAHAQRLNIMLKLLDGPATYQALKHTTKLKAGPLYHHIAQLRLAGLILPRQRDLYELTRGGRNLMLTVAVVGPLTRDRRRRPMGS